MAAVSTSRRGAAGIALIVAGALLLLAVLLPLAGVGVPWLAALGILALAVALVILALGAVNNRIAQVALFVAAAGFLLFAVAGLGIFALPAGVLTVVGLLAAAGGIIGAIVLYTGKEIRNRPAVAFIITMILAALYILAGLGLLALGTVGIVLTVLFAVALIVTGILFRQSERSRR